MILKKPNFAPVYFIDARPGRAIETVIGAGLEWLQSQPNSQRGIIASDSARALQDLPKSPWLRSLGRVHARNTDVGAGGTDRPLLALFPWRDLLLKLTSQYLDRVSAMCVLTYGETDRFAHIWLDYVGAIDLVTKEKRSVGPQSALDPVVEAAFVSLRERLTGQLCTPDYSSDPNGVATLLELHRHGHELDADKLAAWAIVQGFSSHDVMELIGHTRKVKKGHRYATKSRGTWTPNYDDWAGTSQLAN